MFDICLHHVGSSYASIFCPLRSLLDLGVHHSNLIILLPGVFEAKHKTNQKARQRSGGHLRNRLPLSVQAAAAAAVAAAAYNNMQVLEGNCNHLAAAHRGVAAMMPQLAGQGVHSGTCNGVGHAPGIAAGAGGSPHWWQSLGAAAAASQAYASMVATAAPLNSLAQIVLQQQQQAASPGDVSAVPLPCMGSLVSSYAGRLGTLAVLCAVWPSSGVPA